MSNFRDSTVVIIETGRTHIRAGQGLHDLLRLPTVELPARVGLRRNLAASTGENGASTSNATSSAKVTDYLVGTQLDEALAAGQDLIVSWPFAEGDVSDYTQAEALWKHVLFHELKLRRAQMESPIMLSFPAGISRNVSERICQIFFERFNAAGFAILERPMSQFYAAISGMQLSGVVVDVDEEYTDVTPIYDGFILHPGRTHVPIGLRDCLAYLAHLLRSNTSVMAALSPADNSPSPEALQETLLELAKHTWQSGLIKALAEGEAARDLEDEGVTDIAAIVVAGKERAVIESGMKRRQNAKAQPAEQARAKEMEALDLVTTSFRGMELTLGKERHRFCEPLFDPSLLDGVPGVQPRGDPDLRNPLQVAVGEAVAKADVDQRAYIWQGLFVTGEITNHIKGLGAALSGRLAPYILSAPDVQSNEVQPRHIKTLRVPDYFAEYRDKGDGLAAFLGTSIIAKLAFNDSAGKNYVSKADYANKGPRTILGMSPTLL
ncbi:actin-like ATPase domain-containing protein [Polyporus arcularius HHB13444]|uniref:Actin-like ATPase domain-containing protein n=1 Tax=Polyporus arcularius HHB13444 TaxID=1314778 RepID=A0A5C3PHX8_9APHY|nr:actin-like ATPase domain-containing protein [Polyporus arcularius HHB13444]